jgi:hypothetical protein
MTANSNHSTFSSQNAALAGREVVSEGLHRAHRIADPWKLGHMSGMGGMGREDTNATDTTAR